MAMTQSFENKGIKTFDLKAHDARFHGGHFDSGTMSCKFRDRLAALDEEDDLGSAGDWSEKHAASAGDFPDEYGSILSGEKLCNAIEDYEALEAAVAKSKVPQVRQYLEAQMKNAEANIDRCVKEMREVGAYVSNGRPYNGPRPSIPHDDAAFPRHGDVGSVEVPKPSLGTTLVKQLAWDDVLSHYADSDYGWESAGSGSTAPHKVNFNGRTYFVKKAGYGQSTYDKKACRNEVNANRVIRMAGFQAPDSEYTKVGNDRFSVTTESDLSGGTLSSRIGDPSIDAQIRDAYPLMALMYNMDLMQNADNAFVDGNGNAVFLDNGSTFGYSAQGARNKYFDFDKRTDPDVAKTTNGGLTGLLDVGNSSSSNWNAALGSNRTRDGILKLCAKYNMGALVRDAAAQKLILKSAVPALEKYADKLDALSAQYKSSDGGSVEKPKLSKQSAYTGGTLNFDPLPDPNAPVAKASGKSSKSSSEKKGDGDAENDSKQPVDMQTAIEQLAKKHGVTTPTIKRNDDGTVTLEGFGTASDDAIMNFMRDLNESGMLPGFIASLTGKPGSGNAPVVSMKPMNTTTAQSVLSGLGSGYGVTMSKPTSSGAYNLGFSKPLNASLANLFASSINKTNKFPGYTAKATQNSKGEWTITLYPKNAKKGDDGSSEKDSSPKGSGTTASAHVSSSSSSDSDADMSDPDGTTSSSASASPSVSQSAPAQTSAGAGSSATSASAPAPQPAMTQTQVQNAQKIATQMAKAQGSSRAIAYIKGLMNRPNLPASTVAAFNQILTQLGATNAPTTP